MANVSEDMLNALPLFFSNFLVRKLRSCWDGTERVDDALPLAKRGPLGGEAFVVAYQNRAGGSVIN